MVKSMLNTNTAKTLVRLAYTPIYDPIEDRDIVGWGVAETFRGIVSRVDSSETVDVGQDVMTRAYMVRVLGDITIDGRDKISMDGITYNVDGDALTATGVTGVKVTTFSIGKARK